LEFISEFLGNLWHFSNLIAFYIIFGLIIAAIIKQIMPDNFIQKHIGSDSIKSIFKAAIFGIPLPLCSCSVIPFATSLRKSGASKSAIQTFLISTPITGVDSIIATYGVFGWFFTAYRVAASVFISILAGFLSMLFIKDDEMKPKQNLLWQTVKPKTQKPLISLHVEKKEPFIVRVYTYAFTTLFKDIAKSLLIGIVLGSLLSTLIPADMTSLLSDNLFVSYIFVLLISIPLYVCAITSIPIGITLILTGFSPGTAFVFLTAGPATSLITMSVVKDMLGIKSLAIYLFSVIVGTIIFAYFMDTTLVGYLGNIEELVDSKESATLLEAVSTVFMYALFLKHIFPKKKSTSSCCG